MMLNDLKDLFVQELRDLYDAEHQITRALPKMANAASSTELRKAFNNHLEQTQGQIQRLERIFTDMGVPPQGKKCKAMEGIISEGEEVISANGNPSVKDAALIAAAQRVEHYEIAGYGAVRTYAKELGHSDAASLLQKTLDEEGKTDDKLTSLATGGLFASGINEKAERR